MKLRAIWTALMLALLSARHAGAVGSWTPLVNLAPTNVSHMLLLSDGRVIAQGQGGLGTDWYFLTPNNGSYANGTWSTAASMHETRQYYASDVLPDGRVFVAGGEYGFTLGGQDAEIYDPVANSWTQLTIPANLIQTNLQSDNHSRGFADAPSIVLPGGKVLIVPIYPVFPVQTLIYDPYANTWTVGPNPLVFGGQNEASWVKLADGSILTIDKLSQSTERYIPSQNTWVADASVPVGMYSASAEIGAGVLLPTGKAIFFGGAGNTVIYTPSGNTSPGSWVQGPSLPGGFVMRDAPAAMMSNGKILLDLNTTGSDVTNVYYEYDPVGNSYAQTTSPRGGFTNTTVISDATSMLDLPDGNVLFADTSKQVFIYNPGSPQLAAGKPAISSFYWNGDGSLHVIGTQLNGISQGAVFGDDLQMDSNYPLGRFTSGGTIAYGRSFNWSSTGVQSGGALVTTEISVPATVFFNGGSYGLQIVANGIASDPVTVNGAVWVDFNYTGGIINGSFSFPYKTMAAGIGAVQSHGAIFIKPGLSHETPTINTPMTITAMGGTAIIGQ